MTPPAHEIGIGATADLSLRVSVAALARVLFRDSDNDELMLALERKATLRRTDNGDTVRLKAQPFGGGLRILDVHAVHDLVGDFHFDSARSQAEQDFRIFIRPSAWPVLREFCIQHIGRNHGVIFETGPTRELVEEFAETLSIDLRPEQYVSRAVTTLIENKVAVTENIYAPRTPTVRVYRIYQTSITDVLLAHAILKKNAELSYQGLCELAIADAHNGGKGKANAVLALPWRRVQDVYRAMAPAARSFPVMLDANRLDSTVAAILDDIAVPRYQRV